ncbi:HAD family hydrolase [Celeribacter litoreus]|uniref:HAD family hydrolase n=1 Tax=Celeribacter litoreus TaxID=2876714 RepID=UPI001CCE10E1|nr:HAD family hydrolase [Celeribacter litoreus]MCA0042998.1 HAD family hydrolase [Celeribacter litoreus]
MSNPRPGLQQPIQAILFDKDGTLIDFQASWGPWAVQAIERMCGDDRDHQTRVAKVLGVDMANASFLADSRVIAGTPDDVLELLSPCFPQRTDAEILRWLEPQPEDFNPVAVPRLTEVCEWLTGRGLSLAVVTNDFEVAAKDQLVSIGIETHFREVIGYDSGYGGKPAPDPCRGAAARLGIAPEACVMVGDSLHDLEAGRAAGMLCVGVLTGVATRGDLDAHADVVLESIAELPDWLSTLD